MQAIFSSTLSSSENKIKTSDSISVNDLPFELIQKTLGYLSFAEVDNMGAVSKLFNHQMKEITANTKIFGKKKWKEFYNKDIGGEISSPSLSIFEAFRSDCFNGTNNTALTFSILLMPQGLTPAKLKIIGTDKNKARFSESSLSDVFKAFEENPIERSYWVAITDDVIEGTRGKSISDQKDCITRKINSECQIVKLIEVVTACFMNQRDSGKHLFGINPLTYTTCQEDIDYYSLVVGSFENATLTVNTLFGQYPCYGAAVRKELSNNN
jgi:hypothetical protein